MTKTKERMKEQAQRCSLCSTLMVKICCVRVFFLVVQPDEVAFSFCSLFVSGKGSEGTRRHMPGWEGRGGGECSSLSLSKKGPHFYGLSIYGF